MRTPLLCVPLLLLPSPLLLSATGGASASAAALEPPVSPTRVGAVVSDVLRGCCVADSVPVIDFSQHVAGDGQHPRPAAAAASAAAFDVAAVFAAGVPLVLRGMPLEQTTFIQLTRRFGRRALSVPAPGAAGRPSALNESFLELLAQLRGGSPLEFFAGAGDGGGDDDDILAGEAHTFASVYDGFALQSLGSPLRARQNFNRTHLTLDAFIRSARAAATRSADTPASTGPSPTMPGPRHPVLFAKATLHNFGLATAAEQDFAASPAAGAGVAGSRLSLFHKLVGPSPQRQLQRLRQQEQQAGRRRQRQQAGAGVKTGGEVGTEDGTDGNHGRGGNGNGGDDDGDNDDHDDRGGGSLHLDADVWVGTAGAVSHPHYDLQHNMYVQLDGEKAFFLAPMPLPPAPRLGVPCIVADGSSDAPETCARASRGDGRACAADGAAATHAHHPSLPGSAALRWLFPAVHGRHRQVKQPRLHSITTSSRTSNSSSTGDTLAAEPGRGSFVFAGVQGVVLRPGDVLYIPPLHLHSGVSLSALSASMSVCTDSLAELIPLPFEMAWPFAQRVQAVRRFTSLLVLEWAARDGDGAHGDACAGVNGDGAEVVRQFVHDYLLARYVGLWVPGSPSAQAEPEGLPEAYRARWDEVRRACSLGSFGGARVGSSGGDGDGGEGGGGGSAASWMTPRLAAKFKVRAASTVDALNDAMPPPPPTARPKGPTESARGRWRAEQALLLADHVDVVTALMLGADAAYPMLALCYT